MENLSNTSEKKLDKKDLKAVVIGKGPAGISAAIYLLRAGFPVDIIGKDYGALDKADKVENYYGFAQPVSGRELIDEGVKQAKRLGANVIEDEVVGISFEDKLAISTKSRKFKADALIIATGTSRPAPNIKGIKEYEGRGISYCAVCDAFFYRGKKVAVIGDSDYALHEAMELSQAASQIILLTNGKKPQVSFPQNIKIEEAKILEIKGDDKVNKVVLADKEIDIDGIFVASGVAGSADFARKLGLQLNNNKIVVDENQFTGNPGIFAAGDCTGGLLQISVAVGEGAVAGTSAVKYLRTLL
ncbi:MAG: FAD-dependent oxidoreductase [Clostridiales bacterium]|nr:FAD-dependent oxidoreductase [Clostridiales bacterium]